MIPVYNRQGQKIYAVSKLNIIENLTNLTQYLFQLVSFQINLFYINNQNQIYQLNISNFQSLKFILVLQSNQIQNQLQPFKYYTRKSNKKGIILNTHAFTTFTEISLQIQKKLHIDINDQELYYKGIKIQDQSQTLRKKGVAQYQVIHVIDLKQISKQQDNQFSVKAHQNKKYNQMHQLTVRNRSSLASIRQQISLKIGVPAQYLQIGFKGGIIQNYQSTVLQTRITKNDQILILDNRNSIKYDQYKSKKQRFISDQNIIQVMEKNYDDIQIQQINNVNLLKKQNRTHNPYLKMSGLNNNIRKINSSQFDQDQSNKQKQSQNESQHNVLSQNDFYKNNREIIQKIGVETLNLIINQPNLTQSIEQLQHSDQLLILPQNINKQQFVGQKINQLNNQQQNISYNKGINFDKISQQNEKSIIKISIKDFDFTNYQIEVNQNENIKSVTQSIGQKCKGLWNKIFELTFNGEILKDNQIIKDVGIKQGDVIYAIQQNV